MKELKEDLNSPGTEEQNLMIASKVRHAVDSRKVYIESYGCQMNFSDSEIVASILQTEGFDMTDQIKEADLIFLNTCSIREKAEQTVRNRLQHINSYKKQKPELLVGVLGCMAERLKAKFLDEEKIVDLVVGPDSYRNLPELIGLADGGGKAVNTFLSREETYGDISPMRLNSNGVTAFISIMRGCDNMCSFCVVPFTRGRERSREPQSIVSEVADLFLKGFREVTLLGQNVDSYKWSDEENNSAGLEANQPRQAINFANLLERVAQVHPDLRVRFSTSHPKDITDEVLRVISRYENICNYIHLPVQSGNTRVLGLMNRGYSRDWYIERVKRIREILGDDCGLSSDMITGFCSEAEEEHSETLSLMEMIKYDFAYMFMYSERPGTLAEKKYKDDIHETIKKRRLTEIINLQCRHSLESNQRDIGKTFKVLIEGKSRRSDDFLQGRNSANKVILFPKENSSPGHYVRVRIDRCTGATLIGQTVK